MCHKPSTFTLALVLAVQLSCFTTSVFAALHYQALSGNSGHHLKPRAVPEPLPLLFESCACTEPQLIAMADFENHVHQSSPVQTSIGSRVSVSSRIESCRAIAQSFTALCRAGIPQKQRFRSSTALTRPS